MSLSEVKEAALRLSPNELSTLTAFLVAHDNALWDEQMQADAASGKLDFLFDEAEEERAKGLLREWPER